jgi:hypothetical protein
VEKHWSGQWPNLNSVSIALGWVDVAPLSPLETGVLYRLLTYYAGLGVHTQFSGPSDDPKLPIDDAILCRIAQCTAAEWRESKTAVLAFFDASDDGYRLRDQDVIRLSRTAGRSALPLQVRAAAFGRDGERCVYCGSTEGPFQFDHLFPVSRGGRDEPNNIVISCAPCNLSKGAKTLQEWRNG